MVSQTSPSRSFLQLLIYASWNGVGTELYSRAAHRMFRASPYHYIPIRGIAIMFIVLFAISTSEILDSLGLCRIFTVLHFFYSNSRRSSCILPHVVALSYCLSLWYSRNFRVVRETVVKFWPTEPRAIRDAVCPFHIIFFSTWSYPACVRRITATILGPTPFLAANFVIFGIIIQRLGTQFSRLSPKWCTSS